MLADADADACLLACLHARMRMLAFGCGCGCGRGRGCACGRGRGRGCGCGCGTGCGWTSRTTLSFLFAFIVLKKWWGVGPAHFPSLAFVQGAGPSWNGWPPMRWLPKAVRYSQFFKGCLAVRDGFGRALGHQVMRTYETSMDRHGAFKKMILPDRFSKPSHGWPTVP